MGTSLSTSAGLRDITTKYEGWIEKLFVNATWTAVKAGDPLFEIYSPDLYNAELELSSSPCAARARRRAADPRRPRAPPALRRARPASSPELARTGEAPRTYVFRAPAAGVVIEKTAVAGQMVKPGEASYRLADLSYGLGERANLRTGPGLRASPGQPVERALHLRRRPRLSPARIDRRPAPRSSAETRTAAGAHRPAQSRTGAEAGHVRRRAPCRRARPSAVLVPDMAVLRSGERNTVFVALADGSFEPRAGDARGAHRATTHEVLSGLAAGERVVISGQFLLDSESQLREAIQKMLRQSANRRPRPRADATPPPRGSPPCSRPSSSSR